MELGGAEAEGGVVVGTGGGGEQISDDNAEPGRGPLEGVSWVKVGAGQTIREWAIGLTEVQAAVLRFLGAEKLLPVA